MATADPAEHLQEEATCSICLDYFQDPVTIAECQHDFCRACITSYRKRSGASICCPMCRKSFSRQNLKPNRRLENMVEAAKILRLQLEKRPGRKRMCKEHKKPLIRFCETEKTLVCTSCERSEAHRKHRVLSTEEAAADYKVKLLGHLEELNEERNKILPVKSNGEEPCQELLISAAASPPQTRRGTLHYPLAPVVSAPPASRPVAPPPAQMTRGLDPAMETASTAADISIPHAPSSACVAQALEVMTQCLEQFVVQNAAAWRAQAAGMPAQPPVLPPPEPISYQGPQHSAQVLDSSISASEEPPRKRRKKRPRKKRHQKSSKRRNFDSEESTSFSISDSEDSLGGYWLVAADVLGLPPWIWRRRTQAHREKMGTEAGWGRHGDQRGSNYMIADNSPGAMLSRQVRESILIGNYVDLFTLLQRNNGKTLVEPSFADWLEAFSIYAGVVSAAYPERAWHLFRYLGIILKAKALAGDMAAMNYDFEFRWRASNNPYTRWDLIDENIWFFVVWPNIQGKPEPTKPSKRASRRNPFHKVCWDFNREACNRAKCKFIHECYRCLGLHPGFSCDKIEY